MHVKNTPLASAFFSFPFTYPRYPVMTHRKVVFKGVIGVEPFKLFGNFRRHLPVLRSPSGESETPGNPSDVCI